MDGLFSCRNCIHNAGQTLTIGRGTGFCLHHDSIIRDSRGTTCKYLHRKDLPWFAVDEAKREHAAEYAAFSGMVDINTREAVKLAAYSEKSSWETHAFDPLTNVLARYHKSKPSWIFIESLTGGVDGRRSIAHGCLVRRYMANRNSWKSSYRLVMAVVQELSDTPYFRDDDLYAEGEAAPARQEALWDLVFIRLGLLQEYGWHAGLEYLQWIPDALGDAVVDLDWEKLQARLAGLRGEITGMIVGHARQEGEYFAAGDDVMEFQP
jgi:hypothetical protein